MINAGLLSISCMYLSLAYLQRNLKCIIVEISSISLDAPAPCGFVGRPLKARLSVCPRLKGPLASVTFAFQNLSSRVPQDAA
jgi:hypothetical protein